MSNVSRPASSGCSSASRTTASSARSRSACGEHRDPARRRRPRAQARAVERHGVRKLPPRDRRVALVGERPAGDVARLGEHVARAAQGGGEVGHPRHALVAQVPDEAQHAPGDEHARDLRQRRRPVEPVERLTDEYGVGASVGQRDPLRRAVEHPHRRQGALELGAHVRQRLDGDHVGARGDQHLGQLAGARGEVDDPSPRRRVEHPLAPPPPGTTDAPAGRRRQRGRTTGPARGRGPTWGRA